MGLKDRYIICEITKKEAKDLVSKFHYLGDKDFLYKYAYGLVDKETYSLVGCAVFAHPNGNVTLKGWFGVENDSEIGKSIYELTRLVLHPTLNGGNVSSYLLSNAIKNLRRKTRVCAIITLADGSRHVGYVYQACNFKYYGVSDKKKDFYMYDETSSNGYRLNPRGKVTDKQGIWLDRSIKHRYVIVFEKNLRVLYKEEKYPKGDTNIFDISCCRGKGFVIDNRFMKKYSCPICVGELRLLEDINISKGVMSFDNF